MTTDAYMLSRRSVQRLEALLSRVDELEARIAAHPIRRGGLAVAVGVAFWDVKITESQEYSDNQWWYGGIEVYPDRNNGWTPIVDGMAWSAAGTPYPPILCATEGFNTASGIFGNGVDSTHLVGTFTLQPIRGDRIVQVFPRVNRLTGLVEYVMYPSNAIDGECPEE